jgi:hypothetical protein
VTTGFAADFLAQELRGALELFLAFRTGDYDTFGHDEALSRPNRLMGKLYSTQADTVG